MGSKGVRSAHSIDVWRLFAAFLVVCVHFPLPGMAGGIAITYAKTAVPFFIIVSGYFCYRDDRKVFAKRLGKQILKMAVLCVFANVLFFGVSYYMSGASSVGVYKVMNFTDTTWKDFWLVNQSPFADHLWFLGSMVYAMLIVLLLVGLHIHNYVFFISPLLLGVYIYMSRSGNYNFLYCRNAVFCTMPYFMYGCLIRRYEEKIIDKINKKIIMGALLIAFVGTFLEFWHYKDVSITFIGPELLVILLVIFLVQNKNLGKGTIFEHIGRRDTLFIYIMHFVLVLYFYDKYASYAPSYIMNFGTVIIFFATLVVAELFQIIKYGAYLLCKNFGSHKNSRM